MRQVARTLIVTALTLVCVPLASQENAMAGATPRSEAATVRPGVELFVENPPEIVRGKRVGLITNHSGIDRAGRATIDLLMAMPEVELVALFSPEHGIRGDAAAGARIDSGRDEATGLPVHSLYGETRKPTPEMLEGIEALIYDILDVGVRQYTYESTLTLAMEAAAEKGIPIVVLDRPNPVTGRIMEGNVLEPGFESFIGIHTVLSRHGMTLGELARMYNAEREIGARLTVVRVEGWTREMWYDESGLPWVNPSPNLRRLEAVIHYPGTVFFETVNVSEGRGTEAPFEQIGAPWLKHVELAAEMNALGLAGIRFDPIELAFEENTGRYPGQRVNGIRLVVTDRDAYRPIEASLLLIERIRHLHPDEFQWRGSTTSGDPTAMPAARHAGTTRVYEAIEAGTMRDLLDEWEAHQAEFSRTRAAYLLYE